MSRTPKLGNCKKFLDLFNEDILIQEQQHNNITPEEWEEHLMSKYHQSGTRYDRYNLYYLQGLKEQNNDRKKSNYKN